MTENKVIFENKPQTYLKLFLSSALAYGGICLFLYIISRKIYLMLLFPALFLFDIARYEFSSKTFEGWHIEGDQITLLKRVFNGLKTKSIKLNNILSVSYFKGTRRDPSRLIFQLDNEKASCNVYYNIFDLAGTLKFFQSKGIIVKLLVPDDEIQMYLDGKIASVPMTN